MDRLLPEKVDSRQVVRRRLFVEQSAEVKKTYALPRKARRKIARSLAKTAWQERTPRYEEI